MAELLKIEVTKKEFEEGILLQNHVMMLMDYDSNNATTRSGLIYGVLKDLVYADNDNPDDNTSHAADLAENSGIVVKVPQKLYFNPEDRKGMNWECDMELEIGDRIWTNTIETMNAVCVICENKIYKLIPYADIYCAKRTETHMAPSWDGSWGVHPESTTKVIMLNGFVLCRQKNKESISNLDVTSEDKIYHDRGIVAYYGTPNKRYITDSYVDFQDLQAGDEVMWDHKYAPFLLDRTTYAGRFDDKELFWVVPRRRIIARLNRQSHP